MEVTFSNKGKPVIHYLGYAYGKRRENSSGVVFWRCEKQRSNSCTGRLRSKGESVLEVTDHQCGPPDEAALEVKTQIRKAKKRAREESTSISQIYTEEIGVLHNKGYDFVTAIPSPSTIKRGLQINRSIARGNQEEPKTNDDIVLDDDCVLMEDGSQFLLQDDSSGPRMIIFSSRKCRETLVKSSTIFMDGTFKSCSKQFAQIYTIHVDLKSTTTETNVHPVVFCLLPDKKTETYERMFRLIREEVPEWNPSHVNIDFEAAAISAVRNTFPEAQINGCYFHFKKCLWRKIQDLSLVDDYRTNGEIRHIIKLCSALSFLKLEDVDEGFLYIHSEDPQEEKLQKFRDYFVDNWMDNPEIPQSFWPCYNRRHRTTNSVEGWHHKINYSIANANPRVKDLISFLKKEAETTEYMSMRVELHLEGKRRKLQYIKSDERIRKIIEDYNENGNIINCLNAISYLTNIE